MTTMHLRTQASDVPSTSTTGWRSCLSFPAVRHALLFALVVLACAFPSLAETVLPKSDMRLWETVPSRSSPLEWPWEEGADAASLVFSNHVTHAVSSVSVSRAADEPRGSCAQPVPSVVEDVVDVTLTQTAKGMEVSRETATLAYVSGAGGGPITVRAIGTSDWTRLLAPRVYAVDPAWQGLSGESGYDIAWPLRTGLSIIVR